MFELGRVRALDIAKRRVVLHNTRLDQVVQLQRISIRQLYHILLSTHPKQILLLTQSVKITTAPWEGAKVLVDCAQQALRGRNAQRHLGCIRDQGVVGAFHLADN